jgi:hypothetical protein
MKMIVRLSRRAFFNLRPTVFLPVADSFLVAFHRPTSGPLARPIKLAQDAPDVVLVVSHSALVLDEVAHPPRGPQSAGVPESLRTALERPLDLGQLVGRQLRWPTGARRFAQSPHPGLLQLARPTADRLAVHSHPPRHLGLAQPLPQQSRRFQPPPLQPCEVPPHTRWISHALHINRIQ